MREIRQIENRRAVSIFYLNCQQLCVLSFLQVAKVKIREESTKEEK